MKPCPPDAPPPIGALCALPAVGSPTGLCRPCRSSPAALLALGGLLLTLAGMGPAEAGDKTRIYGWATAPYWEVGDLDKELSRLCRQGRFNQRHKDGLYIGYVGPGSDGGRTMTGIAKQGYNLFDPLGKAQPATTYHFHNDGYSTCKVYVAREQPGAAGAAGGAAGGGAAGGAAGGGR